MDSIWCEIVELASSLVVSQSEEHDVVSVLAFACEVSQVHLSGESLVEACDLVLFVGQDRGLPINL